MVESIYEDIIMILYVSFYELYWCRNVVVVLDLIQIVTIQLLIHYCLFSTTYANTIYNVKISNETTEYEK